MKHKPLARQLTAQFFRGNVPMFALAVFAALTGGTLNLIVTWLMQQLIDAASGLPGAYLALSGRGLTAGAVILFVNLMNFMIEPVAELPALLTARKAARGLIVKLADALEQAALRRYDGILVLKDGRIAESGSFDELMEQKGYFYALYTVSQ